MHTRIETTDYCQHCGQLWCTKQHAVVAVFGSALYKAKPNDVDILWSGGTQAEAESLGRQWADAHGFENVPLELHRGNAGTIWSPPDVPSFQMLRGNVADLGTLRPWNVWKGEAMLSSLLRRYPFYGWSGQQVAIVQDSPMDRQQMGVGLKIAGIPLEPWQQFLNGGIPPFGLQVTGGWIIPTEDIAI